MGHLIICKAVQVIKDLMGSRGVLGAQRGSRGALGVLWGLEGSRGSVDPMGPSGWFDEF